MIMFTITKPRRKLKKIMTAAALMLLIGIVVPGVYYSLSAVGAMSLFASGDVVAVREGVGETDVGAEYANEYAEEGEAAVLSEKDGNANIVENDINTANSANLAENTQISDKNVNGGNVENAEGADNSENDEKNENYEKPGLWQSLLTVIFGETPEIVKY